MIKYTKIDTKYYTAIVMKLKPVACKICFIDLDNQDRSKPFLPFFSEKTHFPKKTFRNPFQPKKTLFEPFLVRLYSMYSPYIVHV
jgi:hypothetical protein